jgi:hypothetical protein
VGRYILLNVNIGIFQKVILPVVLFACENLSLTFKGKRTIRVFENRLLREIFGSKKDGVKGSAENYVMSSLMICTAKQIFFEC